MSTTQIKKLDGEILIPARWVAIVIGGCVGSLLTAFYLFFSVGSLTSRLTMGQELQGQRISAIETDRLVTGRDVLARVKGLETTTEFIKDQNHQILDLLQSRRR